MLELCSDPQFPEVPFGSDFSAQTNAISDTMTAYICGKRRALPVRAAGGTGYPLSPIDRNNFHFLKLPVSVSPNLHQCFQIEAPANERQRVGRSGELHPAAPVVAWRAPLRAPRFTVLTIDWRSIVRRVRVSEV
jgi:hypothetical protein